jgi:hypothetical protein
MLSSGKHRGFTALAVIACLVYTVGIPVTITYILKTRRSDPRWRSGLSFLYNNYEGECFTDTTTTVSITSVAVVLLLLQLVKHWHYCYHRITTAV